MVYPWPMSQVVSNAHGGQARTRILSFALSFVLLATAFSIPALFPRFAGHRAAWLLFGIIVAAITSVIAVPFRWLERQVPQNIGIAKSAGGFLVSCLGMILFFHYAALPSDAVFLIVILPLLLAGLGVFVYWRRLFAELAEMWGWSPGVQRGVALSLLAAGLAMQNFLIHVNVLGIGHVGVLGTIICLTMAGGSFPRDVCAIPGRDAK